MKHVEAAVFPNACLEGCGDAFVRGHVRSDEARLAARRDDLVGSRGAGFFRDVEEHHEGPLARKQAGGRAPDAGRGAGHECGLALEPAHARYRADAALRPAMRPKMSAMPTKVPDM